MSQRPRIPSHWALLPWILMGLGLFACDRSPRHPLSELCAGLRPAVVEALVADDSTFARFAREEGWAVLDHTSGELQEGLVSESVEDWQRRLQILLPPLKRVGRALEQEYHCPTVRLQAETWESLPPEAIAPLYRRVRSELGWLLDQEVPVEQKIPRILRTLEELRALGLDDEVIGHLTLLAQCHRDLGDYEEQDRLLHEALDLSRQRKNIVQKCQILGVLGAIHFEQGRPDSMRVYYDRALAEALRCRLPMQAGRILSFYGSYYADQGRFALALDLLREAEDTCRRLGGQETTSRFLRRRMLLYSSLGRWAPVRRMHQQASQLLQERRVYKEIEFEIAKLRNESFHAQDLMVRGEVDAAVALYRDLDRQLVHLPEGPERARHHLNWAQGLQDNGRWEEAHELIDQGLAMARRQNLLIHVGRFQLLRAEDRLRVDEFDAADDALWAFRVAVRSRAHRLRQEWMQHDLLACRIAWARGDPVETGRRLRDLLLRLESVLNEVESSAHGYLLLERFHGVRTFLHELLQDDPELGYAFEMGWRRLPDRLGQELPAREFALVEENPTAVVRSWCRHQGSLEALETLRRALGPRDRHLLFVMEKDALLRWSVGRRDLVSERLPLGETGLDRKVDRAIQTITRDHPAEARTLLHELSVALLVGLDLSPATGEPPFLLVSPDGALRRLPFELLLSDGRLLLEAWDIAYLRYLRPMGEPSTGPAVIVSEPALAPSLRRRNPSLVGLPGSREEALRAAATFPGSTLLEGADATRDRLRSAAAGASVLYVASHVIRDPELPFASFLPLAVNDETGPPEEAYLDVADVRAMDLGGCGLVVLSACRSGAPEVEGTSVAPSLGDAFIDAGAEIAVQTLWPVEDRQASRLMRAFLEELGGHPRRAPRALGHVRREWARSNEGATSLRVWAAYTLQLGSIAALPTR